MPVRILRYPHISIRSPLVINIMKDIKHTCIYAYATILKFRWNLGAIFEKCDLHSGSRYYKAEK